MSLLDLSNKIDSLIVEIIQAVNDVAAESNVRFFVVGAMARDIILNLGYDLQPRRMTKDIDLAFHISTWKEYEQLTLDLMATGFFNSDKQSQRFKYKGNHIVDIIPFGAIGDKNEEIYWPPDHDTKMNVMGFDEAYNNAQKVRLQTNPDLEVLFATPVGLTLMKIISWQTGNPDRKQKDAYDLDFLIKHYCEAGNIDRLYHEYPQILEKYEFDTYLAGAYLLGLDVAQISERHTLSFVYEIINRETKEDCGFELIRDITIRNLSLEEKFDDTLNLLNAFKDGIEFEIYKP
jgi:predicted nucleotidyltransferase